MAQDGPIDVSKCDVCNAAYETPELAAACEAKPILPAINSGMAFNAGPNLRRIYLQDEEILPSGTYSHHPRRIQEFVVNYFGKPRDVHEIKRLPIDTIVFMRSLHGTRGRPLEEMSSTQLEFFRQELYGVAQEYKACKQTKMRIIKLSLRFRVFTDIEKLHEAGKFPELFEMCKELPEDFFWRIANDDYEGIGDLKEMYERL